MLAEEFVWEGFSSLRAIPHYVITGWATFCIRVLYYYFCLHTPAVAWRLEILQVWLTPTNG